MHTFCILRKFKKTVSKKRHLASTHIIVETRCLVFSKNNKKMIAERSAERTLKYGLVKLNVGLASVLLATGLTFAGGQAAVG